MPMDPSKLTDVGYAEFATILRPAVERFPEGNVMSVMLDIENQEAVLWSIKAPETGEVLGAIVTRMVDFDSDYKPLIIEAMAIDPKHRLTKPCMQWISQYMEDVAIGLGRNGLRIVGRKGWVRILDGYKETGRTFDRRLE